MTEGASTGYVTDVPYPRKFIEQLSPPQLRLVAALNGREPPPEEDFDYCELGCASGDTLTTLAAASPKARFVGVDLSAGEIAIARARAIRGELSNVTFVEQDFELLLRDEGPAFDFIVAHGVWTWISAPKRNAMLDLVRARLKPGGLFYLSYNALPGWAAVEPLRRLMRDHTKGMPGTPLDRARAGVAFAQRLADSGVAYFGANPAAKSMLALIQKAGLAYVVHEYFHADWEPMYFADVADTLARYELSFLGQLPAYMNVKELAIPPSLRKTAEGVTDRNVLEGLKDYATNELFRSDVYVKGKVTRSPSETRYFFEGTRFGTMTDAPSIKREAKLPFFTIDYGGPQYEVILDALAASPQTAMQLALRPELAQLGQSRIGDCLQSLSLGGQVVAMSPAPSREGDGSRFALSLAHNRVVLDEACDEVGPLVLASRATQTGVRISLIEALALKLLSDVPPSEHAVWLEDYATRRTLPLTVGDKKIRDKDELARVVTRELERLRSAPDKLIELGILERRT
jgi:SAM-dependent methyltransferase